MSIVCLPGLDLDLIMPFKKTGNLQLESLPVRETPFYQNLVFQAFRSALQRSSPRDTSQCYACLDLCLRILPVGALAQQWLHFFHPTQIKF